MQSIAALSGLEYTGSGDKAIVATFTNCVVRFNLALLWCMCIAIAGPTSRTNNIRGTETMSLGHILLLDLPENCFFQVS